MMHGILPLWKERGMTSHDCVFKVRNILKMKKVGHTGTLDPSVNGVLPICLGNATRIAEYITDSGKTYEAVISIGRSTTTEDAEGETVLEDTTFKSFSKQQILAVFEQLTGRITQTPPMFSAVKVNGRRLYEYARAGQTVERPSREVMIYGIELVEEQDVFEGETVTFKVRIRCGKGTYIRTLAVQMGDVLGYPAHMELLTRTVSGTYTEEECVTLEQLKAYMEAETVEEIILPIESALDEYPSEEVPPEHAVHFQNGLVFPVHPRLVEAEKMVFTNGGKAVAVYVKHPTKDGLMKPEKIFPKIVER